jgi:hypothetical protein
MAFPATGGRLCGDFAEDEAEFVRLGPSKFLMLSALTDAKSAGFFAAIMRNTEYMGFIVLQWGGASDEGG